jgi:TonB family protein
MFEALIASRPPAPVEAHRYFLSLSFHSVLIAAAVALTRQPARATHMLPPEGEIFLVAPEPISDAPSAWSPGLPGQTRFTAPTLPRSIEAPELGQPIVSARVPTVADLLNSGHVESRGKPGPQAFGLNAGTPLTTEPLTPAAVDDPVAVIEQPAPRYPLGLAEARITGRVELTYIVDTTGRAEPGSLRTLMSTHPAFDTAARASVLGTRYRPARLQGRLVRQLVRQTLTFRLAD